MKRILVVGEDKLCCSLGEKLVASALPSWQLASTSIDTKGVTKLIASLARYIHQAKHVQPVLCIADTDNKCAKDLLSTWVPSHAPNTFIFRLAVTEAESWILADRHGFSENFKIPTNKIPTNTDQEIDPKRLILNMILNSKKRIYRDEMISQSDINKPGAGYNLHLDIFVNSKWNIHEAAEHSESLRRAFFACSRIDQQYPPSNKHDS